MGTDEDVFSELFNGTLKVTIEGERSMGVDAIGEPLFMLIALVECMIRGTAVVSSGRKQMDNYQLISFDRAQATLVVKRK